MKAIISWGSWGSVERRSEPLVRVETRTEDTQQKLVAFVCVQCGMKYRIELNKTSIYTYIYAHIILYTTLARVYPVNETKTLHKGDVISCFQVGGGSPSHANQKVMCLRKSTNIWV